MHEQPKVVWREKLSSEGIGGIAAADGVVVVGSRDLLDREDVFDCFRAESGELLWQYRYPAPFGEMDYGKSPRATPLIVGDRVILLGALGHLSCVDLKTGAEIWQLNFVDEFDAVVPTWGFCGSPLLLDKKSVVVQPGAESASLVAINIADGELVWETPGRAPSYSSFIIGMFGEVRQLVGYDQTTLGGWDVRTGERLWEIEPRYEGDFNVPTPIAVDEMLFVTTENNGSRFYRFGSDGKPDPKPIGKSMELAPDTHSPIRIGKRIIGINDGLHVLKIPNLETLAYSDKEGAFMDYASIVTDGKERALVVSEMGELVLLKAEINHIRILDRQPLAGGQFELNSHPAFFGSRIYFRQGREVVCAELGPDTARPSSARRESP